jgi:hypothetical protein
LPGQPDFSAALLESIDEAIGAVLGQDVVPALHLNLKNKRSIDRAEIPDNIPTLCVVFEKYFGPGARTIERAIARRLYSKLGLEFSRRDHYELTDYVENARGLSMNRPAPNV